MKKSLLFLILAVFSFVTLGCTGGAGTPDSPSGENPGIPSSILLIPAQFIAQTNSSIYLKARVFDGNGKPLPNIVVYFTNLTEGNSSQELSSPSALTDYDGFAVVTLFSSTPGFATVQAEISVGSDQVRDKKTVYFSPQTIAFPSPTLTLEVDSNDNGIFNEPEDFILLQGPDDNQAVLRATVYDMFGRKVGAGMNVTFSSDDPTEVAFPLGRTEPTDFNSQATTFITITPSVLRPITTLVNMSATATNGAFNLLTLFLDPVVIGSITLSADPMIVASGGTSNISATIMTSAGTFAPNGTTVNFLLASHGTIEPFAQTSDGVATAIYTAPTLAPGASSVTDEVTASVGGVMSDPLIVTVTAPLVVVPPSTSAQSTNCGTQTKNFTITGGTGPYSVISSDPANAYDTGAGDGLWTNVASAFTVTIAQDAPAEIVTFSVTDSMGSPGTATLMITHEAALVVTPSSATIAAGDPQDFIISGGTSPYSATLDDTDNVIASMTGPGGGDTFTLTAETTTEGGNATVTVEDDLCYTKDVPVTVTATP